MLNLSDKELDRLAREAADEYDPGNLAGPGAWDRMQLRLDKELGNIRPDLFRSIRRTPFYYAPAILLLVGVSYYLLRPSRGHLRASPLTTPPAAPVTARAENSGSPPEAGTGAVRPLQAANDRFIKNKNNTYSSTSTPYKENSDGNKALTPSFTPETSTATHTRTQPGQLGTANAAAPEHSASTPTGNTRAPGHAQPFTGMQQEQYASSLSRTNGPTRSRSRGHHQKDNQDITSSRANDEDALNAAGNSTTLALSSVRLSGRNPLPAPIVDDSGLRKLGTNTTAKAAEPINPGKKRSPSLHIDRPLQLGLSLAPDFAAVKYLAGDKPGSSIGITADYQLLSRLHLHTGFLFSHKNYSAAPEDYHVPYGYYRMNNMHDVSFVKGTLNLFEIPLALRYDFTVAGNTMFFASAGLSSYLLKQENCNYYFDLFGRTASREFRYGAHKASLFGTVDLSMGVETGLSNSLSFLVAPYMKLPTTGLGFGRIEMSSVGVEFGLKYTPVLRRKRH